MIANLEALAALADLGTMTRAAARLRITQSAVSKRIAALEGELSLRLVESAGRGVRLTPAGENLLDKTSPFMGALKDALNQSGPTTGERLVIGISESILASWGAGVLYEVQRHVPDLEIGLNAHRSPVALDHVRSGEYMLALCAGEPGETPELKSEIVLHEPMVIIPAGLRPFDFKDTVPVLTIEPHASTWRYLERRLRINASRWKFRIVVERTLQSFACIAQIAKSGLAHGLVPLGIAKSLGIDQNDLVRFPEPGLTRPISLVGRSRTWARPVVRDFHTSLNEEIAKIIDSIS